MTYTKIFLERFWDGKQKNELFVCMPFHDDFDKKFELFNEAAEGVGFSKAKRVKEDWDANVITDKILDGIANSRLLLFDLSDDPKSKCDYSKQVNANVIYELGIATTIRDPQDIILIRDKSSKSEIPFDIKGMTINFYNSDLSTDWLKEKLTKALEDQRWYKSKRVKAAAHSIDDGGLWLMLTFGIRPDDLNHFNTLDGRIFDSLKKLSVLRLLDLGILWFDTGRERNPSEHAYHWTPFGDEVMKYLKIYRPTIEKFKETKPEEYAMIKKANDRWVEDDANQKKLEGQKE